VAENQNVEQLLEQNEVEQLLEKIEQEQSEPRPRVRGFQYERATSSQTPTLRPAPPPGRSLGRAFVVLLILAGFGIAAFSAWDAFGRYRAYGVVGGHMVHVSANVDGLLRFVHVQEGDNVRQDETIATLHNLQLNQQLTRVADELQVAEAQLHAETAKLHWTLQQQRLVNDEATVDFLKLRSLQAQREAELSVLLDQLKRAERLDSYGAITAATLHELRTGVQGQHEVLARMTETLTAMTQRTENADGRSEMGFEQLSPTLARIAGLLNESVRIRERLAECELKSPVNGTIVKRHKPAGEMAANAEPIFEILEEGSLHVELYLPQKLASTISVGDELEVQIDSYSERVACEVVRMGEHYTAPPAHVQKFYRPKQALLAVYLRPKTGFPASTRIPVGAVVKLPSRWNIR
jgi:HlyD family secretion protein